MDWLKMLMDDNVDGTPGGGAPVPEPIPESAPEGDPEPTPEQQELEKLKAENAELKARNTPPPAPVAPAPAPLTSATLESYTSDQWAVIEEKTGKTRDQIITDFKHHELTTRQNAIDAKSNTADAVQDAVEANPKLIKLRGAIKEYLETVPLADKLDPAKLKRQMEIAVTYAKGKHMSTTPEPATPKGKPNDSPNPKGNDDDGGGDDGLVEGEMANGEYTGENGLRLKLGKVDKATWKKIQHKTKNPNGVSIPADFDKPPVFK